LNGRRGASVDPRTGANSLRAKNAWNDTARNTVDRLKHIIAGLNGRLAASIPKSGKKRDHIDRIRYFLNTIVQGRQITQWQTALNILQSDSNT
jgi:hypothetical protein